MADRKAVWAEAEHSRLSWWGLWLGYLAWGGTGTPKEIKRHLRHGDVLNEREDDLLVNALNERSAQKRRRRR